MKSRSRPFVLLSLFTILLLSGCGGGATDDRLVGDWVKRSSMVSDTQVTFSADGSATVTVSDDKSSNYKATWEVLSKKGDTLNIRIKPKKGEVRERSIEFKGKDTFEMFADGKLMGRYQRK